MYMKAKYKRRDLRNALRRQHQMCRRDRIMKADNTEQLISPDKAVRWRGDRQAFLANRGSCSSPGKLEWKTFKPTIDSDKTDCMDKAVKWARRD